MVEAGLIAAILTIIMIGSYYVPFLSTVFYIIIPMPVIVLMLRNTMVNAIGATVVASILTAITVMPIVAISNFALAIFVGLPLGWSFKHKYSTLKSIGIGGVGALIAHIIIFATIQIFMGVSPSDSLEEMFNLSSSISADMSNLFGNLNNSALNESLSETQAVLDSMVYLIKLILPSAVIIFSMVYSGLNCLFARPILKRLGSQVVEMGTFENFRYPRHMAFGSGLMLVLAYLVGYFGIVDPELVFSNFMYLFLMVFSVQGLALVYYIFRKFMPKGFAVALIAMLMLSQFLYYISLMGFIDVIFDIRTRAMQKR